MARIGLLEDNARIAKLCVTMLHYAGHQVTTYKHPRECLHSLLPQPLSEDSNSVSSQTLPIDVLVLDLHLPEMSGTEVIRRLQSDPHTQPLPIIFCTAASPMEIARALDAAPQATIVGKPFTYRELTGAIDQAIQSRVT